MTALTHGALRAEFLAAEAVNADIPIDMGFLLPYRYRFGRTDLCTLAASDAL